MNEKKHNECYLIMIWLGFEMYLKNETIFNFLISTLK